MDLRLNVMACSRRLEFQALERDAAFPRNKVVLAESLGAGLVASASRVDDQLKQIVSEGF